MRAISLCDRKARYRIRLIDIFILILISKSIFVNKQNRLYVHACRLELERRNSTQSVNLKSPCVTKRMRSAGYCLHWLQRITLISTFNAKFIVSRGLCWRIFWDIKYNSYQYSNILNVKQRWSFSNVYLIKCISVALGLKSKKLFCIKVMIKDSVTRSLIWVTFEKASLMGYEI